MDKFEVDCFKAGDAITSDKFPEFDRQLQGQQDGLNDMTVQEYLDGRAKYKDIGRGDGKAQRTARKKLKIKLIREYKKQAQKIGLMGEAAKAYAENKTSTEMATLAALHNPDMIAGGKDMVEVLGDRGVNSSIGSQWRHRIDKLDNAAEAVPVNERGATSMNVALSRCK
ncbi:polymorphic toxin type 15 domain-containing protein [Agarivorans gilvus]|nr:polymorphic toxin type 15 domain-containing protein [Agarivorans gilvus]